MSILETEDRRIERLTLHHADTRVSTLTAYVCNPPFGGDVGFPVSGDMLALIRQLDSITERIYQ